MKKLLLFAILLPACAIPGDSAWSGLHANGFGGGIATNLSGSMTVPILELPEGESIGGAIPLSEGSSTSSYYGGRIGLAIPVIPLELVYSMFNHSSNHPFSDQLSFTFNNPDTAIGGTLTETLDVSLSSSLDFDLQKILLEWDLFNSPAFRVGLLLGVDLMTFNGFGIELTDNVIYNDGTDDYVIFDKGEESSIATAEQLPIPMIGLRGDVLLPFTGLRAGVEVSGFTVDIEQVDVTYLDIDANLNYAFNKWTEAVIGYRSVGLDLSGDLDDGEGGTTNLAVDIKYDGPYFGIGFVF